MHQDCNEQHCLHGSCLQTFHFVFANLPAGMNSSLSCEPENNSPYPPLPHWNCMINSANDFCARLMKNKNSEKLKVPLPSTSTWDNTRSMAFGRICGQPCPPPSLENKLCLTPQLAKANAAHAQHKRTHVCAVVCCPDARGRLKAHLVAQVPKDALHRNGCGSSSELEFGSPAKSSSVSRFAEPSSNRWKMCFNWHVIK